MKKKYYILTAIVSYFAFLIVTIPAKPVIALFDDDVILITGVSGTLWNGKAHIINIDKTAILNNTKWSFSGWKIFTGKIAIDINTQYFDRGITAELGSSFLGRFFINDLNAEITADNVARLANIPIAQLSGLISVDIEHAQWKQGELPLATGVINWKDATVSVTESASLGDVSITLSESEEQLLIAEIKNQGGDIKIGGSAELVPEENYAVNITLSPTATASNNIKQSLGLFSKKQNNGTYLINNTGSLNQIGLL